MLCAVVGNSFMQAEDNALRSYDKNTRTATIKDPFGNNPTRYDFNNVQAYSNAGVWRQGTLIGSFDTPNWVQPQPDMVGYREKTTELYCLDQLPQA